MAEKIQIKKIYQLAKELNRSHDTLIEYLVKRGHKGLTILSLVTDEMMQDINAHFKKDIAIVQKQQKEVRTIREQAQNIIMKKEYPPPVNSKSFKAMNSQLIDDREVANEQKLDNSKIGEQSKTPIKMIADPSIINLNISKTTHLLPIPTPKFNYITVSINRNKESILNTYKIKLLYHMSHISNLGHIFIYGLLSHNAVTEAVSGYINIANSSVNQRRSNKIDPFHRRKLHDYVPLYFNPKNPMLYVRKNIQDEIVILGLERNLIYDKNSIFTDGNAASSATSFYCDLINFSKINWECIFSDFWNTIPDGRRIRCAEVLVYPSISIQSIKKIFCHSKNAQETVLTLTKPFPHIDVTIDHNLFF